jgi:hypothetical protein
MTASAALPDPDARARRNVRVLVAAQALLGAQMPVHFILGGLAGQALAANKCFSTLPVSAIIFSSMLTAPAMAAMMQRRGRTLGFVLGCLAGALGGLLCAAGCGSAPSGCSSSARSHGRLHVHQRVLPLRRRRRGERGVPAQGDLLGHGGGARGGAARAADRQADRRGAGARSLRRRLSRGDGAQSRRRLLFAFLDSPRPAPPAADAPRARSRWELVRTPRVRSRWWWGWSPTR